MNRLNGWVRLGLVFSAIWVLLVLAVAGYELVDPKVNRPKAYFVYADIPSGTYIPVPEGRDISEQDLENPSVKKVIVVQSQKLLAYLFVPVVGGWLLAAGLVFAVRWVRAGFHQKIL